MVECKDNKLDWVKKIKYENNLALNVYGICGNRAVEKLGNVDNGFDPACLMLGESLEHKKGPEGPLVFLDKDVV